MSDEDYVISEPVAINMLLFFRAHPTEEFGTRAIQKIMKIKSSSTASRYLKQLDQLGILEKTASNMYKITLKGMSYDEIAYKVLDKIQYYNGKFIPKYSFLLTFILISTIFTIVLLIIHAHLGIIVMNSILTSLVTFLLLLREWDYSRKRYYKYLQLYEIKDDSNGEN